MLVSEIISQPFLLPEGMGIRLGGRGRHLHSVNACLICICGKQAGIAANILLILRTDSYVSHLKANTW